MRTNRATGNRVIRPSLRGFYRWHRRVGMAAALFVVLLTVTGIVLNHNAALKLHTVHLQSGWLHSWYGLPDPKETEFPGLTADRVLLDLHTGKFFGQWGPYVMDAAALAFLFLTGTGFYLWWRRHGEQKRRGK